MSTTWWWPWASGPPKPRNATDASHNPAIRAHFTFMLDSCEPPETFKPSQVCELLTEAELAILGYEKIEEALPAVYELAFELRAFGDCLILRKGKVLDEDVELADLDGPIRIMRNVDG